MSNTLKDLRYALRALSRQKGWTAVVLLSLALGIGANTALFTAVNGLMLETIPARDADALVRFHWIGQNDMVRSSSSYGFGGTVGEKSIRPSISFPMFQEFQKANQTLTGLAAGAPSRLNVLVDGTAELASSYHATGQYFEVLGVPALIGRVFSDDDDRLDHSPVAVISHAYWQKRFGGEASVLNRVVSMNNVPVTIVGVLGPAFKSVNRLGDAAPEVFVPLAFDQTFSPPRPPRPGDTPQTPRMQDPTYWWLEVIGRMKPDVELSQVQANLGAVFQNAARAGMESYMAGLSDEQRNLSFNRRRGSAVPDLLVRSDARGYYDINPQTQRSASFLSAVVLIVLLIVCANVANLLLSRATTRERELAIRLSIGATRRRLIRQLLTESLLLAFIGGALGVAVGYWLKGLLPFGQDLPLDWRVLGFVAGVSMLTGVVFGLAPAVRATRVDLSGAMKEGGRGATASRHWLGRGLLVVQVALSLILIIGAGLFLRTLDNLRHVDVGFDTKNLLIFNLSTSVNQYAPDRSAMVFRQTLERVSALPGVRKVALTRTAFLSGSTSSSSLWKQGQTGEEPSEPEMYMMSVSPTFFETMGVPLQIGRTFTEHDTTESPKVIVLNEAAARKLFPDGNILGRRVGFSPEQAGDFEVIGVVRDVHYNSLRDPGPPTAYQAALQGPMSSMNVVLRTAGDPMDMVTAVRSTMHDVDPTLPIQRFSSQTEEIEGRFAQERLFARAYTFFGLLALTLASIGLFGLLSYNVARRTNEIGIRMALGAQRGNVVGLVMRESLVLVGLGVAIGLGTAIWAGRFVTSVLFGLSATDGFTIGAAIALIVLVSSLAGFIPARRASRVDPMTALHLQ